MVGRNLQQYVQEVGTMNIFFVLNDKVITPAEDGAILKGVTRMSLIQILKSGYTCGREVNYY